MKIKRREREFIYEKKRELWKILEKKREREKKRGREAFSTMEIIDQIASKLIEIPHKLVHFIIHKNSIYSIADSDIFHCKSSTDLVFSHDFSLTENGGSHGHWLHWCPCFTTACKCDVRGRVIRSGYALKSSSSFLRDRQHARNLILYLFAGYGYRQFHQISGPQTEELGRLLSAFNDFIHTEEGRYTVNEIVGSSDGNQQTECGYRQGEGITESCDDNLSINSSENSEWAIRGRKRNIEGIRRESACEKTKNLLRELWPQSLIEFEADPRYQEIWKDFYNQDNKIRIELTNNILNQEYTQFQQLSFQEIIIKRSKAYYNPETYYDVDLSVQIILRLLISQLQNKTDVIEFIFNIQQIIDKQLPKKNTIYIKGLS